jgi:tRNA-dihydrouridine synthase
LEDLSIKEKVKLLRRYVELLQKYKVYNSFIVKQSIMQFTKGYEGGKTIRREIMKLKDGQEMLNKVDDLTK